MSILSDPPTGGGGGGGGLTSAFQVVSNTSTVTRVPASTAPVTLFEPNAGAISRGIYSDSAAALCVALGPTVSTTSFTRMIAPRDANGVGGFWELPSDYTDVVTGVWIAADGTGAAVCRENT